MATGREELRFFHSTLKGRRMTFLVPLLWFQTKQRVPASSARTRCSAGASDPDSIEHRAWVRNRHADVGVPQLIGNGRKPGPTNAGASPRCTSLQDAVFKRSLFASLVFVRNHHAMETGCKNELPPSKRGIRQCCQLQPFSSLVFRMTGRPME
jgi:hypothetical protein